MLLLRRELLSFQPLWCPPTHLHNSPLSRLLLSTGAQPVCKQATSPMAQPYYKDVVVAVSGTHSLSVVYGTHTVKDGERLTKQQTGAAPRVTFDAAPGKAYSLVMVDPDAPSPDTPTMREWLHWLVVNVPGGDVAKGQTVVPYGGPTPPRGTHRYIVLLYEQPDGLVLPVEHLEQRGKFKAAKWAAGHGLSQPPVAALHFLTAAGH